MNTEELMQTLLACPSTARYTLGVFPVDLLPIKITKLPAVLICNTDPSTEPGTHWLAIYLRASNVSRRKVNTKSCATSCTTTSCTAEFFDPFGYPPAHYSPLLTQFLQNAAARVIYNNHQVQAPYTLTCGLHCLYFLKLRCNAVNMIDVIKKYYTTNLLENDVQVTLKTQVKHCTNPCTKVQKCIAIKR
jgi:hypothetical protein